MNTESSNAIDHTFLDNMVTTCQQDALIREDGKELGIFTRIIDFFRGKRRYNHFETVCQKLVDASNNGLIQKLDYGDRLEVFSRVKFLANRLGVSEVKSKCSELVGQVEKTLFSDKAICTELVESVFVDFKKQASRSDTSGIDRDVSKIQVLVDIYGSDQQVVKLVADRVKGMADSVVCKNAYKAILNMLLDKEEKNISSIDKAVYLDILSSVLTLDIQANARKSIHKTLHHFREVMEKNRDDQPFIHDCLKTISSLMSMQVFDPKAGHQLAQWKKSHYLCFRELFFIADNHIKSIETSDPKLFLELKLQLANLPPPVTAQPFANIQLTECEQRDILSVRLQELEDKKTDELVKFLNVQNVPKTSTAHLAKLVANDSYLNQENREKLRTALTKRLEAQAPKDWSEVEMLTPLFDKSFAVRPKPTQAVTDLYRTAKTKEFFVSQAGLSEEKIFIPRWFHATHRVSFTKILESKEIQVRHEKIYKGAWVSNRREAEYGTHAFSLSHRITKIDPTARINTNVYVRRWRGLQKAIPLQPAAEAGTYLGLVAYEKSRDKTANKVDKLKVLEELRNNGYSGVKAVSEVQFDHIATTVEQILGAPNLTDAWWGSGFVASQHQLKLHTMAERMAPLPELLESKGPAENQQAIATLFQQSALGFYKELMPQKPSYQVDLISQRVELGYEYDYASRQKRVEEKLSPARSTHGTMHAARVTLWTQVLARLYEKMGRERLENPILTAFAGSIHDAAREAEGIDYWDGESAELLDALLKKSGLDQEVRASYVQAIREKDPKGEQFTTEAQRIVHDADCLDIIRVRGRGFNPSYLQCYNFEKADKTYMDAFVKEVRDFIALTEPKEIRTHMEHESQDFYGDLVRILFAIQKKNPKQFPIITELIRSDMQLLLDPKETPSSLYVLNVLAV